MEQPLINLNFQAVNPTKAARTSESQTRLMNKTNKLKGSNSNLTKTARVMLGSTWKQCERRNP